MTEMGSTVLWFVSYMLLYHKKSLDGPVKCPTNDTLGNPLFTCGKR